MYLERNLKIQKYDDWFADMRHTWNVIVNRDDLEDLAEMFTRYYAEYFRTKCRRRPLRAVHTNLEKNEAAFYFIWTVFTICRYVMRLTGKV